MFNVDDLIKAYRRQIEENHLPSFTGIDDIEYQRYAIMDVLEHCHILDEMKCKSNKISTYEQF